MSIIVRYLNNNDSELTAIFNKFFRFLRRMLKMSPFLLIRR